VRRGIGTLAIVVALVLGPSASAQFGRRDGGGSPDDGAPIDRASTLVAPVAPSRHHIPLSGGAKHLIVHGTFNGVLSGPMLIDTGASYCVITRDTARRLGVTRVAGESVPVATANGEVAADLVALESIQIEDARLRGVEAVIMDAVDPPLVGIIGLSFLNQFRRYSVDQARGTIQLER
jgi:clan AA aspartic protease (TIGR02281 family)